MPQGFKNFPTIFGTTLASDLRAFPADQHGCVLLQHVDDFLQLEGLRRTARKELHSSLPSYGKLAVRSQGKERPNLSEEDQVPWLLPVPGAMPAQPREKTGRLFNPSPVDPMSGLRVSVEMGATGFCRIWIPNFSVLLIPLYEATKGEEQEPLLWEQAQQRAFEEIKWALTNELGLGLPDMSKPFFLYVHERTGIMVGVLTQTLGSWHHPVAYLSQLDSVAQGWPSCLPALAAMALLVSEADWLTMGK